MNNTLTPCQQLGYQEGDLFIFLGEFTDTFVKGTILILTEDDNTNTPQFSCNQGTEYSCSYLYPAGAYTFIENVSSLFNYFEDIFNVSKTEIALFSLAFGFSIEEAKTKIEEAIELKNIWNEHKGILK